MPKLFVSKAKARRNQGLDADSASLHLAEPEYEELSDLELEAMVGGRPKRSPTTMGYNPSSSISF